MNILDKKYMQKAIRLAKKGVGKVNPNPLVGCVIVKNGKILSEAFHQSYGGEHAELIAINRVKNKSDLEGATLYVNLEPCCHHGKTEPCVDKIIEAKITRVVIGMIDPNPKVNFRSIKKLQNNEIEVTIGILQEECEILNEKFIKFITGKYPFCLVKSGMSIDGKIATKNYDSKWITNKWSRLYAHKLRYEYSAILCGINTIIHDNPTLNVRHKGFNKITTRIIIDSELKINLSSNVIVDKSNQTIIATISKDKVKINKLESLGIKIIKTKEINNQVDLKEVFKTLKERGYDSILVEGGGSINAGLLSLNLVDKINLFIAPIIITGDNSINSFAGKGYNSINEAFLINNLKIKQIKGDFLFEGYINKEAT